MESSDPLSLTSTLDIKCDCTVCEILKRGFSSYTTQEKKAIVISGRPTPVIDLQTQISNTKKFTRHFKLDYYEKHKWLTGCTTSLKLFCWPCVLFNQTEKNAWTSNGFSDLNNFHKNVKRHCISKKHLTAVLKEKTFMRTRIDQHCLNQQSILGHNLHNELVTKNREVLRRVIDIVCYLGMRPSDKNYVDLLNLFAKYDEPLNANIKNFTGEEASMIHSNLVSSIADVVMDNIKKEISEASFVSLMLDQPQDANLISVAVRYVQSNGTIYERFFKFLNVTSYRTAKYISNVVCGVVEELEAGLKLIAQSYDGSVIKTNHLEEIEPLVKEICPHAKLVHNLAHHLNLVLMQGMGTIKECKVFFSALSGLVTFFAKSSKRSKALNELVQQRSTSAATSPASIQWIYSGRLITTILQHRDAFIALFKHILDSEDQWDNESVNATKGYLQLFTDDRSFNFLLVVFSEIFPHIELLNDILRSKSDDIEFCVEQISVIKKRIEQNRGKFSYFWSKMNLSSLLDIEPLSKKIKLENGDCDLETTYYQLFIQIIDNLVEQLIIRFSHFHTMKFVELCNFKGYTNNPFPIKPFDSLKLNYCSLFDTIALHAQLSVLYNTPEVNIQKTPLNMLRFLRDAGLEDSYNEVITFCELVLTLPSTNVLNERSSSALKRIKEFVHDSSEEEILSNAAVLAIEQEFIGKLAQNPKFYEDVIDKFAEVNQTIELRYK